MWSHYVITSYIIINIILLLWLIDCLMMMGLFVVIFADSLEKLNHCLMMEHFVVIFADSLEKLNHCLIMMELFVVSWLIPMNA